jgi:GDP-L-fucose synthase
MVGSQLVKKLKELGYNNLLTPDKHYLDFRNQKAVNLYFNFNKPEYVFHLAAKVGGIQANIDNPVIFLNDNLLINSNIFYSCNITKVKKVLYLGSSCIYPTSCPQPMKEEYLLDGKLESTNEGYALSKIVGLKLAEYYYKQYGLKTICLMPPNLYHEDKIANENSHVFEMLIKKICDAKIDNLPEVEVWGDGESHREFMHVEDLIDAMLYFFDRYETPDFINVGTGVSYSIAKLVQMICEIVDYKGNICWDLTKPNGMRKKCLNINKMSSLGFVPKINICEGIKRSVKKYKEYKGGEK